MSSGIRVTMKQVVCFFIISISFASIAHSQEMDLIYSEYLFPNTEVLTFRHLGKEYSLSRGGLLSAGNNTISLLPDDYRNVSKLYYASNESDLLLVFEDDFFEGGTSYLYDLDVGLKVKWKIEVGWFNLTAPVRESDALYVSTIGTLYKIDLRKGAIVWKHDDLYEKYGLDYANSIAVDGKYVTLLFKLKYNSSKYSLLKFDKTSGVFEK